jgi:hypothetical protein
MMNKDKGGCRKLKALLKNKERNKKYRPYSEKREID